MNRANRRKLVAATSNALKDKLPLPVGGGQTHEARATQQANIDISHRASRAVDQDSRQLPLAGQGNIKR
jgi:hypothetical protein